jgi:hypothetical protein
MSKSTPTSRPERVLLLLARHDGECRGKAIRFADETEFRFESMEQLTRWLLAGPEAPAPPGTDNQEPRP